jgi:hypothetical protein
MNSSPTLFVVAFIFLLGLISVPYAYICFRRMDLRIGRLLFSVISVGLMIVWNVLGNSPAQWLLMLAYGLLAAMRSNSLVLGRRTKMLLAALPPLLFLMWPLLALFNSETIPTLRCRESHQGPRGPGRPQPT